MARRALEGGATLDQTGAAGRTETQTQTIGAERIGAQATGAQEKGAQDGWTGPRAASVVILAEIDEGERRARYQIPVAEALRARALGRVLGAGQMFTDADLDDPEAPAGTEAAEPETVEDADAPEDADDLTPETHNLRHALHCVDLELFDVASAAPVVLDVLRAAGGDAFDQGVYLEIHHSDGQTERLPVHKRQ